MYFQSVSLVQSSQGCLYSKGIDSTLCVINARVLAVVWPVAMAYCNPGSAGQLCYIVNSGVVPHLTGLTKGVVTCPAVVSVFTQLYDCIP